jgi:hypothetical protein
MTKYSCHDVVDLDRCDAEMRKAPPWVCGRRLGVYGHGEGIEADARKVLRHHLTAAGKL